MRGIFFFNVIIFLLKNLNKFVLKIWISRKISYFVGILSGVGDISLSDCPQIFFLVKRKDLGIFLSHIKV